MVKNKRFFPYNQNLFVETRGLDKAAVVSGLPGDLSIRVLPIFSDYSLLNLREV